MNPPDFGTDDQAKWRWLEAAPLKDSTSPVLQQISRALRMASLGRADLYCHLALAIARDGIRFQIDSDRVGREDLGHPLDALYRGIDDCDAKSRLFVALCLIRGLPAKMMPLWKNGRLTHVYGAVKLNGKWYPAETTLSRARLGDLPKNIPKEERTKSWART